MRNFDCFLYHLLLAPKILFVIAGVIGTAKDKDLILGLSRGIHFTWYIVLMYVNLVLALHSCIRY